MNTKQTTHCYRIADMLNGGFGSCYYELSEAQAAIDSALEDGVKANMELIGIDESIQYSDEAGARAHAKNFLFICAVSEDGTLTAI